MNPFESMLNGGVGPFGAKLKAAPAAMQGLESEIVKRQNPFGGFAPQATAKAAAVPSPSPMPSRPMWQDFNYAMARKMRRGGITPGVTAL